MCKVFKFPGVQQPLVAPQPEPVYCEITLEDIPEVDYEEEYTTDGKCFKCGKSLDYTKTIWNINQVGSYFKGAEACAECMMKFFNL